jgi:hypothetical protein
VRARAGWTRRRARTAGRIENCRRRQQQAGPAHQLRHAVVQRAVFGQIGWRHVHHHLHHGQAGHEQLAAQRALGLLLLFAVARRVIRIGGIAYGVQRGQNVAGAAIVRTPAHVQALGGDVELGAGHAGQLLRRCSISQTQAAQRMPSTASVVSRSPGFSRSEARVGIVVQLQFRRHLRAFRVAAYSVRSR